MPSKTISDRLLELEREVATLNERVRNLRRDMDRIETGARSRKDRGWSLMLAIVGVMGGIVGSIVPGLAKAVIAFFRR